MRAFAIATTIAAAAIATTANAASINRYKVAGWDMGVFTNDSTGRFSHCAASAQYRNGLLLLFSVSDKYEWSIGFSNTEWNLREGREIGLDFKIDGGRVYTVRGVAVSNRLVRGRLPDSVELFNQFRQGYRMVVSLNDNAPVTFNLTDTNPMLTEILQCAKRYKDYADRAPNSNAPNVGPIETSPPASKRNSGLPSNNWRDDNNRVSRIPDNVQQTPPPDRQPTQPPVNTTAGLGPTAESREEAVALATDILRRANFTFEMQKPEQLAENMRKYDAVWRADGVQGMLRVLSGARELSMERVRGEILASDANTCKGKFASGALAAAGGSQSQTVFTSCETQNSWAVYYIAVPRRKGGIYLMSVAGTGEMAARMQAVATAYRTVALEVLEK